MFDLNGKVALIIGAGKLGYSVADALISNGCLVVVCDKDIKKANKVISKLDHGKEHLAFQLDANDINQLDSLYEKLIGSYTKIDILINLVGGNISSLQQNTEEFSEQKVEIVDEIIHTNVMAGMINPITCFEKYFNKIEGNISIINMASVGADTPVSDMGVFSMAKAAVVNYSKWLSRDFAKKYGDRVRVNTIIPGFIVSRSNRFLYYDINNNELTERASKIVAAIPMGRFGNDDDIKSTIVWLAADGSKYVTGNVIKIDGGYSVYSPV